MIMIRTLFVLHVVSSGSAFISVSRIARLVPRQGGTDGGRLGAFPLPRIYYAYNRSLSRRTLEVGRIFAVDPAAQSRNEGSDDIDLSSAMANARANLRAGTSPGAGLESAYDQADAAFADLIVTSIDYQGLQLDDEDIQELAQSGMMDPDSTSKTSKGFFGDMKDVFGALSGGAHIVKRDDGTV